MGQTPSELEERIKQRRAEIDRTIDALQERWRDSGAALLSLAAVGLAFANGASIGSNRTRDAVHTRMQSPPGLASTRPPR